MTSFKALDAVVERRASLGSLATTIAPSVNSDMFKSQKHPSRPRAKTWNHRLTEESKNRGRSTLKGSADLLCARGLLSLGTGRPSSEYFPWDSIALTAPHFPRDATANSHTIFITKEESEQYNLSVALNYGHAAGSAQLLCFVTEHVEMVHDPPYADWNCSLTCGSTSALETAFRMLCSPGDYILSEEYTYAGTIEAVLSLGIKLQGVTVDIDGMIPAELDLVLSHWDARLGPKPFILYTIPTGQNPTGTTQPLGRRAEIYEIAERHDLFIIEDDPYYYLQRDLLHSTWTRTRKDGIKSSITALEYISRLVPSYLSLDTSGRVLRLDSTSKILAPGLRCGWMTASSEIIERLLHHHEVSTVSPSGVSQVIMHKVLHEHWGHQGFLDWLIYLTSEYDQRRNTILKACEQFLPRDICEWDGPKAGMFLWIKVHWKKHPCAQSMIDQNGTVTAMLDIEDRIFISAVDLGVLYSKGSWFKANKNESEDMFLRATYAAAPFEQIEEAITRLGAAFRKEFSL